MAKTVTDDTRTEIERAEALERIKRLQVRISSRNADLTVEDAAAQWLTS